MKYLFTFIIALAATSTFAQPGEEVGPLTSNPALIAKRSVEISNNTASKVNVGTFDSTFIYTSDTLDLPFFDEFSTDKFQVYDNDFNASGVTFDKVYKLLDMGDNPYHVDSIFTELETFRRVVDMQALTTTDYPFGSISVKVGDLTTYPVTHLIQDVYPSFYIYDTILTTGGTDLSPDTLWITPTIYQDSATQFFADIDDTNAIWLDDQAYRNLSMGKDPWSLGVATFDGLDRNGVPYLIGSTQTNYADHLTSKPIDMSVVDPADSMYFSFMYQSQGLCDLPELGDSLVLEFYAHDLNQWNRIWSVQGSVVDTFRHAHIAVKDLDYFKDGFQFRFKNYGGLSGSLDHFHIDYVNLRSLPGAGAYLDTSLVDVALSYPVYTLLEDYTSVPWDHYVNLTDHSSVMSDEVQIVMANSFPGLINAQPGISSIYYNSLLEGTVNLDAGTLAQDPINYQANSIPYSYHDFKSNYTFDHLKPGISQEFEIRTEVDVPNGDFGGNDSTVTIQKFENYYSYDDGSAELAYGPTGVQARMAVQFTPYEADSLIGVYIHFVQSVTDVSNNLFLLTVWDDNGGVPGDTLYSDNLFYPRSPQYGYEQNYFTHYLLLNDLKLPIDGTFYVGWRQLDPERLNVGLDMNIPNGDKTFISIDGGLTWDQSAFDGSVMIRPIFSTGMDVTLGIEPTTASSEPEVKIYPNPTKSTVTIEMDGEFNGVEVYNTQGQLLLNSEFKTVDMSALPNGMYFLKIDGINKLHKIIRD